VVGCSLDMAPICVMREQVRMSMQGGVEEHQSAGRRREEKEVEGGKCARGIDTDD